MNSHSWDTSVNSDSISYCFDDNFSPIVQEKKAESGFAKLPDSDQYLAILERKLKKVERSASQKQDLAKDILKSLEESRKSCMLNFLSSESSVQESTSHELKINPILNKINPEKQALEAEELVQLVKADQLDLESVEELQEQ